MPEDEQDYLVVEALYCFLRGYSCLLLQNHQDAAIHFNNAIAIWEVIGPENLTEDGFLELIDCYEKLAHTQFQLHAFHEAVISGGTAITLLLNHIADQHFVSEFERARKILKFMHQVHDLIRTPEENLKDVSYYSLATQLHARLQSIEASDMNLRKMSVYQYKAAQWQRRYGEMGLALAYLANGIHYLNMLQVKQKQDFDSMGEYCRLLKKCFAHTGAAAFFDMAYRALSENQALLVKFEHCNTALYVLVNSDAMKSKLIITFVLEVMQMIQDCYHQENFPQTRFSIALQRADTMELFARYRERLTTHQQSLTALIDDHPSLMRNLAFEVVHLKQKVRELEQQVEVVQAENSALRANSLFMVPRAEITARNNNAVIPVRLP